MSSSDPTALAIEHMVKVYDLINEVKRACKKKEENLGEGIKRRAKDLPSLISTVGLVPALTFYMSKASENNYKRVLMYLNGKLPSDKELCDKDGLASEIGGGEGAGYSSLLALTLAALVRLGIISGGVEQVESFNKVAKNLKSLHERSHEEMAAESLILDYLIEVKKLAEAFF